MEEIQNATNVIGPSLRTSARTADKDIPTFWQRFMGEFLPRLPRRADDKALYAVYCDYESDFRGEYTMVLGVAGVENATLPPDVRRVRIVPGKYERFVAEGDPAIVVSQTWIHINGEWEQRGERRYLTDFERYAPESMSGGKVKVEVFVGLR